MTTETTPLLPPEKLTTLYMVTYGDAWRQCINSVSNVYRQTDKSYWQWFGDGGYPSDARRSKHGEYHQTFGSFDEAKAFLKRQIEIRIEVEKKKLQELATVTPDNCDTAEVFNPCLWGRTPWLRENN